MQGWCGNYRMKGNWNYEYKLSCQLPWETIFPERPLTLIYLPKISLVMNNKSTDIQVYNESKLNEAEIYLFTI